jgi:hypothetical protein
MPVTQADIENKIKEITGDPASGILHDWTPAIAQAINELITGEVKTGQQSTGEQSGAADKKAPATRVIKADETR